MTDTLPEQFQRHLQSLDTTDERYAVEYVDELLNFAQQHAASDVHLLPGSSSGQLEILVRIDGTLQPLGCVTDSGENIVARLKVLANLLTYRSDIPQEGRVRAGTDQPEMRISTFPTVHGERVVVRLFVGSGKYRFLDDLGFPDEIFHELRNSLISSTGLFVVCGPAGSGKTTTLYAAIRQIQNSSSTRRSICTLEDPIEALIPGISQSQIKPQSEFTYQRGLASLLRQDPEVIMVGEIRDRETAQIAFQASLTGHLVLTSFHSGNAAGAISRLSEMGIEPYILRSGILSILAQRLLRKRCSHCQGVGCRDCGETGYRGRFVIAELLKPDLKGLGRAILDQKDADQIQELASQAGMVSLNARASHAVEMGQTTREEAIRVFGPDGFDW